MSVLASVIRPGGALQGRILPPGDKSISHRSIMFGALASGTSQIQHFLEAEDCIHTLKAFQLLGVPIQWTSGSGKVVVEGVGMHGLRQPDSEIYLGNSGTSMRLLMGILAGQKLEVVLSGDPSLSSRPMKRVTTPLKKMGAQIKGREDGNFAPLMIRGGKLHGLSFDNVLASAQVKSAILFAGLQAEGKTVIREPLGSRDHTERFLAACGAPFIRKDQCIQIERTERLNPFQIRIPGDISSAAFFMVGAAIVPGSEVRVEDICLNPTRTGILSVLERMGADLEIECTGETPEPIGNVTVRGSRLRGTRIAPEEIPSLIDELPILMVAMALAEGESLVSGAAELRVKETDRIASMVSNLNAIGGSAKELPDGCWIQGVSRFHGGLIQSHYDHRTAMSFVAAALRSDQEITVDDVSCIDTSFPTFFSEWERLRK